VTMSGFGVIHTDFVVDAFHGVDRRYFVPTVSHMIFDHDIMLRD
jgi:hypothetical protein